MGMQAAEIEALIKAALPDAEVTIEDLAGDGDHYAAKVVSSAFKGLPRVRQHPPPTCPACKEPTRCQTR